MAPSSYIFRLVTPVEIDDIGLVCESCAYPTENQRSLIPQMTVCIICALRVSRATGASSPADENITDGESTSRRRSRARLNAHLSDPQLK